MNDLGFSSETLAVASVAREEPVAGFRAQRDPLAHVRRWLELMRRGKKNEAQRLMAEVTKNESAAGERQVARITRAARKRTQ